MDLKTLELEVKKIINKNLSGTKDIENIKLTDDFVNDLGADSLDLVELTMAFEEAFDVEIPDEDFSSVNTVQSAIDMLAEKLNIDK